LLAKKKKLWAVLGRGEEGNHVSQKKGELQEEHTSTRITKTRVVSRGHRGSQNTTQGRQEMKRSQKREKAKNIAKIRKNLKKRLGKTWGGRKGRIWQARRGQ